MNALDPSMIEGLSVTKLANILWHSEFIVPEISQNDKTPSWDGQLFLYSTKEKKKANLYGKCNIQVKGKKVAKKDIRNSAITFLADIADLKNYRSDGGVLYFVGYVVDPDKIKFYYGNLLPIDIVTILAGAKQDEQKKITIKLKELPNEIRDIEYVIRRFIKNSRYQYSTTPDKPFDLSSLKEVGSSKLPLAFLGEGNMPFLGEHYFYQKISDQIFQPLGKFDFTEAQLNNAPLAVTVDDIPYFDTASIKFSIDGNSIYLGKCISIANICENKTGVLTFEFKGAPQAIIEGLEFLKALKTGHILRLGDMGIAKDMTIDDSLESLDENIDFYQKIMKLFQTLNVKKSIDVSRFTEQDFNSLWKLYMYIVENKTLKTQEIFKDGMSIQKIGDLIFALVITNCDGGKCRYDDFFDEKRFMYKIPDAEGNTHESSVYVILKKEQFMEWANIDYEAIKRSIFRVPYNEFHGIGTNMLLLEMLKAYDITKNEDILNTVIDVADWLRVKEKNLIYILNYFQAICRKRKLIAEERFELLALLRSEKDYKILAGITAVLGNKEEYAYYLSSMEEMEKEDFQSYPIAYLMQS